MFVVLKGIRFQPPITSDGPFYIPWRARTLGMFTGRTSSRVSNLFLTAKSVIPAFTNSFIHFTSPWVCSHAPNSTFSSYLHLSRPALPSSFSSLPELGPPSTHALDNFISPLTEFISCKRPSSIHKPSLQIHHLLALVFSSFILFVCSSCLSSYFSGRCALYKPLHFLWSHCALSSSILYFLCSWWSILYHSYLLLLFIGSI